MADQQTRDADLVVVGAGLAGLAAARAARAPGASVVVRRGARPRRRPDRSTRRSATASVVEVGGPVDRPDAGPAGRAGARAGRRHVPDLRRRRERHRVRRPRCAATAARSRASTRLVLLDVSAPSAGSTGSRGGCRSTRPGRRPAPPRSTGRRPPPGCAATSPPRPGRMLLELGIEAVWAAQPEDISLLHVLFYIHSAGSLEMLFDTEGGAQQDRFVGGSQRIAILMAQELGREHVLLGAPVRKIERGDHGVTVEADGATVRARRARSSRSRRRSRAGSPTTRRCPATATSSPSACRSARWPSAWRSTTSRSGARRGCRARAPATRAGQADLRQLASRRLAGRAARLPRGAAGARAGPCAADERRTAVVDCFARLFGPRAGRPTATSSGSGPRRSGRAAATAATCRPAGGPTTGPRCASRSARCTGRAPSTHGLERLHGRRRPLGRRYGC